MRSFVLSFSLSLLAFTVFSTSTGQAAPPAQTPPAENVVVAIRYFQVEGVSHSHLYLYRRDGKLVKQLTRGETGQDHDPVFAPDGNGVVYQRSTGNKEQWRMISLSGDHDRALEDSPAWYQKQSSAPDQFTIPDFVPADDNSGAKRLSTSAKAGELSYKLPGSDLELVLKDDEKRRPPDESDWFPKNAWLREKGTDTGIETFPVYSPKRTGKEKEFWTLPLPSGAVPNEERKDDDIRPDGTVAETLLFCKGSPFLNSPPLRASFFTQHRGSTDGVGLFGVDLNDRRMFEMSPNGGYLYVLPGRPEFACVCEQRYLPLGDGQKTVNCSYLDLWDARMQRVRFADARPALCYGAAICVTEAKPVTFRIPRNE
jgi:hypothetical protein